MPRVWSLAVNGPAVAKATKQRARDRENTEREGEALLARRGLFHHMVTLGQVMNCTVRAHGQQTRSVRERQETSVCHTSGVQECSVPGVSTFSQATGMQHVQGTLPACLPVSVNNSLMAEPAESDWDTLKKKWITRLMKSCSEYPRCVLSVSFTDHSNRTQS